MSVTKRFVRKQRSRKRITILLSKQTFARNQRTAMTN